MLLNLREELGCEFMVYLFMLGIQSFSSWQSLNVVDFYGWMVVLLQKTGLITQGFSWQRHH